MPFLLKNITMSLFKFIIVGAAVGYGVNYITKKNENGRSIIEDLADSAPGWLDKIREFADDALGKAGKAVEDLKSGL